MRTKQELLQKIDDDLIWRRRELTDFRAVVQSTPPTSRRSALIRGGVALLYAHWEGFVKKCGLYYLEFVANQGLKGSELQENFLAIKLQTQLISLRKAKKPSATAELIDFFCNKLDERLRLPHRGVVDTKSNLSSSVLEDILWTLGLNKTFFQTKKHLIDSSLVDRRNHIAHGDSLDLTVEDYLNLHDEVAALLDAFRTEVQNAAVTNAFVRAERAPKQPS